MYTHLLTISIFVTVGFLHAWRSIAGTDILAGDHIIPLWVSMAISVLTLGLAYMNWKQLKDQSTRTVLELLRILVLMDLLFVFYAWQYSLSYFGLPAGWHPWILLLDASILAFITIYLNRHS